MKTSLQEDKMENNKRVVIVGDIVTPEDKPFIPNEQGIDKKDNKTDENTEKKGDHIG